MLYVAFLLMSSFAPLNSQTFKIVTLLQNDQETHVQNFEDILTTINKNANLTFSRVKMDDVKDEFQQICDGLANGISLLMDFTWAGNEIAQKIVNNMSIPYIHVDVSIAPFLVLLDAYLDMRNSTDVLLIFDKEEYIDQALYFWLDSTRLRMVMSQSETLDRVTASRIRKIRPIPNSFAIVAGSKNLNKLYVQAQDADLLILPDRWNLVFTDFQKKTFPRTVLGNNSVSLLSFHTQLCLDLVEKDSCPTDFNLQDAFLYWLAYAIDKVIKNLRDEEMASPTESFECNKTKFPEETSQRFEELLELIISDYYKVLTRIGDTVRVSVRGDIEKLSNGSFQVIAQYKDGHLEAESGKKIKAIKPFYRIGIAHALPWSYKKQDPNSGEYYWTGYCADFAHKLSEIMNFDYVFIEPRSGTFGEKINGTWNGVVGDLARGNWPENFKRPLPCRINQINREKYINIGGNVYRDAAGELDTDLAITAIIMTADREEVIDFVAPYYEQTGITIVMRKPVRKTSLFKFMTVLKLEVWLSIVAALIVTGFMVWFLDKYSPYSARNNKKAYPYPCREFTLKESFWFALTSFTPQGGGEAPKALSGRTLVAAYWLFVVLMLATFTANLAAFLTVERMQAPVQSLEQLARQSRINYTVVEDSETHKYFINMKNAEDTLYRMWKELTLNASTDDTRYRVWDYPIREQYGHILLAINDSNPVMNASEGFRIVDEHLDADFAFIHDSSEIKYEISRNCNFTEVGEVFAEKPYAVAVQQGSHLQDDLSKVILDLQKDRFFEQLQAKYWNQSSKGHCPSTDDNEGITLESLGGVFIATLFGLALAMITLAGEVLYYRRKGQKEKEKAKQQISKNLPGSLQSFKPPPYPGLPQNQDKFNLGRTVTIGTTFKPVNLKEKLQKDGQSVNISHITLYPKARNRIARVD